MDKKETQLSHLAFIKKNKWRFTVEEVKELLEKVKLFNCGAIDPYLDNHVEKVFKEWASEKGVKID